MKEVGEMLKRDKKIRVSNLALIFDYLLAMHFVSSHARSLENDHAERGPRKNSIPISTQLHLAYGLFTTHQFSAPDLVGSRPSHSKRIE
jgi:hypothetical protein